ncbi:hypothetical protein [Desulfuromonas sp. TF]|uniref:hypothetical protein n=1 Tax=Desulfuromonas sp. TF TaxID=1232410 RepID=UPI0004190E35|nr:hypothetical protein [Desulfuromonas sp. TF]
MACLRSQSFRSLLLLLLGCSLTAASVLPGFAGAQHRFALETANDHSPLFPIEEKDHRGTSTADNCWEENELPENIPPGGSNFLAAVTHCRIHIPYLRTIPPEVFLERFVPPQNLS